MREMTGAEELAILREVVRRGPLQIELDDMHIDCVNGVWKARADFSQGGRSLGDRCSVNIAECIFHARQHLLAEREKAMSPRETRYKAALEKIIHNHDSANFVNQTCVNALYIARDALKE